MDGYSEPRLQLKCPTNPRHSPGTTRIHPVGGKGVALRVKYERAHFALLDRFQVLAACAIGFDVAPFAYEQSKPNGGAIDDTLRAEAAFP